MALHRRRPLAAHSDWALLSFLFAQRCLMCTSWSARRKRALQTPQKEPEKGSRSCLGNNLMRQSSSFDRSLKPATGSVAVLIGTRKGAFVLRSDRTRRRWKLSAPMFLGHVAHHMALDPRDHRTLLLAARTGHLGPTVFRSTDCGCHSRGSGSPGIEKLWIPVFTGMTSKTKPCGCISWSWLRDGTFKLPL